MCVETSAEATCDKHLLYNVKRCRAAKRAGRDCRRTRKERAYLMDGMIPCPICTPATGPERIAARAADGSGTESDEDPAPARKALVRRHGHHAPPAYEMSGSEDEQVEAPRNPPARHGQHGGRQRPRRHRRVHHEEHFYEHDPSSNSDSDSESESDNDDPVVNNNRNGRDHQQRRHNRAEEAEHVYEPRAHPPNPHGRQHASMYDRATLDQVNEVLRQNGWKGPFH